MISPAVYWLVTSIIQAPMIYLLALVAIFPAVYPVMNFEWEGFGGMLLTMGAQLWVFETMAQANSVTANPLLGMMNQMQTWFMAFLFAGVFLPVDDIIWPFRVFSFILPYRWAFPSTNIAAFSYVDSYSGAHRCEPLPSGLALEGPLANTTVLCNGYSLDAEGKGFYCGPDVQGQCYGRTGKQVIDTLGLTFTTLQSTDSSLGEQFWLYYVLLLLAMVTFWKTIHLVKLVQTTSQGANPLPPDGTKRSLGSTSRFQVAAEVLPSQTGDEEMQQVSAQG